VLFDSKKYHFEALNLALNEVDEKYVISYEEHLKEFDGLPTNKKLELLTEKKGLEENKYESIWKQKQKHTTELLGGIKKNEKIYNLITLLRKNKIKLACASNSISQTVNMVLSKLEIIDFFDIIVSNEDVKNPKPHPEMYWKCMTNLSILPNETLIIEDSPVGRLGASLSGAKTYFVESSADISEDIYYNNLEFNNMDSDNKLNEYRNKKLNILIPMAGLGSRFTDKGYVFPKPLIEVRGKPMIQVVVENLNIDANYIFIVQKEHIEKYNIDKMLKLIRPEAKIVVLDSITEGAASTTLMAKEYINNENPLLIANSDQFINWNPREVMYKFISTNVDGGILTFKATHPKWSYAKLNDSGFVTEVAEKNPISDNATVGIYYWKKGKDYVKSAEEMIENDIRVNNEFYVCPVYNQAIERNKKIKISEVEKMWGIGTPEDLENFLAEYDGFI
jgi:HAD superfamily hydrolase (TIGR01509 family)